MLSIASKSVPININKMGLDVLSNFSNSYIFKLMVDSNTKKSLCFLSEGKMKHSNLIKSCDKIMLCDIKYFVASITICSFENIQTYEIEGYIDNSYYNTSNIFKNNSMYIEFVETSNGWINCNCFYTGDNNKLIMSPP